MPKSWIIAGLAAALLAGGCTGGGASTPTSTPTSPPLPQSSPTHAATAHPSPDRPPKIRLVLRSVRESATCQQLTDKPTLVALLSAFRASRVRHLSVEGCIAPGALSDYSRNCAPHGLLGSPGPFCLYGAHSYRLTTITVIPGQAFEPRPHHYYVGFTDRLVDPRRQRPRNLYEYLTISRAPRTKTLRITAAGH